VLAEGAVVEEDGVVAVGLAGVVALGAAGSVDVAAGGVTCVWEGAWYCVCASDAAPDKASAAKASREIGCFMAIPFLRGPVGAPERRAIDMPGARAIPPA
jgi:hypothetical protein